MFKTRSALNFRACDPVAAVARYRCGTKLRQQEAANGVGRIQANMRPSSGCFTPASGARGRSRHRRAKALLAHFCCGSPHGRLTNLTGFALILPSVVLGEK